MEPGEHGGASVEEDPDTDCAYGDFPDSLSGYTAGELRNGIHQGIGESLQVWLLVYADAAVYVYMLLHVVVAAEEGEMPERDMDNNMDCKHCGVCYGIYAQVFHLSKGLFLEDEQSDTAGHIFPVLPVRKPGEAILDRCAAGV